MIEPYIENDIITRFGKIDKVESISGGANHGVVRVDILDNSFALKTFSPQRPQMQEKFTREIWGMKFFKQCGINIPTIIKEYSDHYALLMEYIPNDASVHAPGIREFVDFIKRANHSRVDSSMPESLGNGLNIDRVFCDCENRIKRLLGAVSEGGDVWRIVLEIEEQLKRVKSQGENMTTAGPVVSAGDFGRHNTISSGGELFFIDFEYCGVDDLSKVMMDFILHPGQDLSEEEILLFFKEISKLNKNKSFDAKSYSFFYELFSMRWSLIVLNPFLIQYLDRTTDLSVDSRNIFHRTQLGKARRYIENAKDFNLQA
jgi:tRNA A-37 threonylcarbamoyl transferase component Bud32